MLKLEPAVLRVAKKKLADAGFPADWKADIAIVLGSALGALADEVTGTPYLTIPFGELWPWTKKDKVPGHAKEIVFGELCGLKVVVFSGRIHGYEGHRPLRTVQPVLLAQALGAKTIILTNAAGGINPDLPVGQVMIIKDHINWTGKSPLRGAHNAILGPRFPGQGAVYGKHKELTHRVTQDIVAKNKTDDPTAPEPKPGVYLGVNGPEYETPAEIAAMGKLGADAVGMSTVHEAIAANECGMAVVGLSLITNATGQVAIDNKKELSHVEVTEAGNDFGHRVMNFVLVFLVLFHEELRKKKVD